MTARGLIGNVRYSDPSARSPGRCRRASGLATGRGARGGGAGRDVKERGASGPRAKEPKGRVSAPREGLQRGEEKQLRSGGLAPFAQIRWILAAGARFSE